jgi:insulysin
LETISKQDVLSLFLTRVHPSSKVRSKLSIHAQSQKPQPKHVSRAASDAFAQIAHGHGIQTGDIDWSVSLYASGEPTEPQFSTFWKEALTEVPADVADKIFGALPYLMERFPSAKDAQGSLKGDVVHIKDLQEFRKSLKVSEPPQSLVDWNDLPTSKI